MSPKSNVEEIEIEEDELEQEEAGEYEDEEYAEGRRSRLIPALVLLTTLGGFSALAWYAYHAGSSAVSEDELTLVEADKTPLKEKPLDPGGMKFPHQDKTIFDAVSPNAARSAAAERIAPAPEEPVTREQVTREQLAAPTPAAETPTKVDERIQPRVEGSASPGNEAASPPALAPVVTEGQPLKPVQPAIPALAAPVQPIQAQALPQPQLANAAPVEAAQPVELAPAVPAAKPVTKPVVKAETPKPASAMKPAAKAAPVTLTQKTVAKSTPKPAAAASAASGNGTVQLGAFKSEAEAHGEWSKIAGKFPSELGGKSPNVIKADLGAKGIFYRLRVSGVDAKTACAHLSAKGQACIPVK